MYETKEIHTKNLNVLPEKKHTHEIRTYVHITSYMFSTIFL